jgi:hypothetical protein
MKAKVGLALAFLLVSAFAVPALVAHTNAAPPPITGLYGAYFQGSFFGEYLPPWGPSNCQSYSAPPSKPSVAPTATTVDSNINTGAPTGFQWMENGFYVNGIQFKDV